MSKPDAGLGTAVKLERVIDGDTVVVSVTRSFPVRIRGLRAPEHNQPGGPEATAALTKLLNSGAELFIFIHHPDKYITGINSFDRVLADMYAADQNVAQWMIDNKFGIAGSKEGVN